MTGWLLSPEFIHTIGPGGLIPDDEDYGRLWMPERALAAALDRTGAFDNLSFKLRPGFDPQPAIDVLGTLLEPYGSWGAIDRTEQVSNAFIDGEITQLKTIAYILPSIFIGITVFLVNVVMGPIVALERTEIGLLKALSYGSGTICLHHLFLAGLVATITVGAGWAARSRLSFDLAVLYANFFKFLHRVCNASWNCDVITGLPGFAAATFGAARAALAAARLSSATAVSPPTPSRFKRRRLDRWLATLKISRPSMMILRGVIRWPIRAGTRVLGMALAVAILISSSVFPDALGVIIDATFGQSNRQHAVLFFNDLMTDSAVEDARRLPGVLQAEGQRYLTAVFRKDHRDKRVVVEVRRPRLDLLRVVDGKGQPIDAPAGGIMLSRRLAAQLGADLGDMVQAEFRGTRHGTFDMPVTALIIQYFGLGTY